MLLIFSHIIACDHADGMAVWALSHFPVRGNGRAWRYVPFPHSISLFRAAKRKLGSAEGPKMNKSPGAKPLPGKLPKGQ